MNRRIDLFVIGLVLLGIAAGLLAGFLIGVR